MTEKSASVLWNGAAKEGVGKFVTECGALMDYPYGPHTPPVSRWRFLLPAKRPDLQLPQLS